MTMSAPRLLRYLSTTFMMLRLSVQSFQPRQFTSRTSAFTSQCLFSSASEDIVGKASSSDSSKICIVGGGFGGLYTALKLSSSLGKNSNVDITLIDPKEKFIFLPLLYELAVGSATESEVAPKYLTLLKGSRVKFIQASVTDVDYEQNEIKFSDGSIPNMKYDQLVMAVGAQPRVDLVPGAKENAMTFYTVEDAYKLRSRLQALLDSGKTVIRAVVLGGGYSGVEVATNIAEFIGAKKAVVSIIDRNEQILKSSPLNNRVSSQKALAALGVSVNCDTSATKITESSVHLKTNSGDEFEMPADIVVITMGVEQSPLTKGSSLKREKFGRLAISRALQSKDRPNVFAIGDCGGVEGEYIPSTAQVAMQQSDIVTRNILYRLNNYNADDLITRVSRADELDKFRYVPLGEMLTLGNKDAAVTSLNGLVELQGPIAAVARRLVYAVRMPTQPQLATALFSAVSSQVSLARKALRSRDK